MLARHVSDPRYADSIGAAARLADFVLDYVAGNGTTVQTYPFAPLGTSQILTFGEQRMSGLAIASR